jgi:Set1/Ash2 histone methyltransferase complex subunit ASH2
MTDPPAAAAAAAAAGAGPLQPAPSAAGLPPRPAPADAKRAAVPAHKRSKKGKKKGAKNVGAQEVTAAAKEMVEFRYLAKGMLPLEERPVELDKNNVAPGLTLQKDRRTVQGAKGYRTARASHGAHFGTWYFEVTVARLGATGHVRLGVCTKKSDLNIPVGADQYGYSYRDLEGTKQHKGLREPYGAAFAEGDVVGVYLHLPEGGRPMEQGLSDLVRYKGSFYFKEERLPEPQPLPGAAVAFSLNGRLQGVAYRDLLEGTYFPAASIFTLPEQKEGAAVSFNFGPDFKHGPPAVEGLPPAEPFCDLCKALAQRARQELEEAQRKAAQEQAAGAGAGQAAGQEAAAAEPMAVDAQQ